MTSKKKAKLPTDKNTDYLFDYFMNEEKFNEQLRGEWDEKLEKNLQKAREPKLDSRIPTDKNVPSHQSNDDQEELPSISQSVDNHDVDFNDDLAEDAIRSDDENFNDQLDPAEDVNSPGNVISPYHQKIHAVPNNAVSQNKEVRSERPLLADKLIRNAEKFAETPEERRARQRDAYSQLQDLVQKYGITLTRRFTVDDDPDEMEEEVRMHKERRHKTNQVKFYKQVLLNVVCGIEFLNDKYNPFEFKLKDWSKQIASDLDDYTEVLEELYEKYKDKGGKMAPEIRLLFMIIMSGVTYHLSNALFGSGGLNDTIQNNPNILNKLFGGLIKGGGSNLFGNEAEPTEAAPNNKNILAAIRKHNKNRQSEVKSEINSTTEAVTDSGNRSTSSDVLAIERERRMLAEQKAAFEEQLRKQQEMHNAQLEDLRRQLNNYQSSIVPSITSNQPNKIHTPNRYPPKTAITEANNYPPANPVNQILSDATRKPRFMENPLITGYQPTKNMRSDDHNIFESEIKENSAIKIPRNSSVKKPARDNYDELLESLEQSSDIDLDDVIETSSRKRNKMNATATKKPRNNSVTRSATQSVRKKSDAGFDNLSTTRKNSNIIKL